MHASQPLHVGLTFPLGAVLELFAADQLDSVRQDGVWIITIVLMLLTETNELSAQIT
jgi:hypothetical protein